MIEITRIPCGPIMTNSYILEQTRENFAWVVDPAEGKPILDFLKTHRLELKGILLTHGHFDHIIGISTLLDSHPDCQIFLHPEDLECLYDPEMNGSTSFYQPFFISRSKQITPYPELLDLAGESFSVIETPGHTPGSVTILNSDSMITGDFLFKDTIGGTDFLRSSPKEMQESLRKMIHRMQSAEKEITVYPGHYDTTTWQNELLSNPFLARISRHKGQ